MKLSICIIGILILMANSIVLYLSFLHAYFYNDYMFIVNINSFGEAHVEFVILSFALSIGFFTTVKILSILTKKPTLQS